MTVDVYEELRREALARIDGTGIDPENQLEEVRELLELAVEDYQRRAHLGDGRSLADPRATVNRLVQSVTGRGPLSRLLDRPDVEEIFIEGDAVTYLEAGGVLRSADLPATEAENRQTIDQLISTSDRRLDTSNPIAQARVLDGSARLTVVIPPVGDQLSATIRKYALRRQTLDELVGLGSLTPAAAAFLEAAMRASASVIISGSPGSGKTSFLSALIAAVPADHCIRSCEEVRELHVPLVHGSYYESRPPSLDGSGEISLRDLVKVILATWSRSQAVADDRVAAQYVPFQRTLACGAISPIVGDLGCIEQMDWALYRRLQAESSGGSAVSSAHLPTAWAQDASRHRRTLPLAHRPQLGDGDGEEDPPLARTEAGSGFLCGRVDESQGR